MKTLRTYLAIALEEGGIEPPCDAFENVEASVAAVRSWLAQPEIMVIISNGLSETGSVGGAALALRREAVK